MSEYGVVVPAFHCRVDSRHGGCVDDDGRFPGHLAPTNTHIPVNTVCFLCFQQCQVLALPVLIMAVGPGECRMRLRVEV